MNKSRLVLVSIIFSSVVLAGCYSQASNPLLTKNPDEVIKFLDKAETYASEKTHLYDGSDSVYLACVKNKSHFDNPLDTNAKNPCDGFLKAMVSYAKQSKNFSDVEIADLQDKAVVQKLGSEFFDYESLGGDMNQVRAMQKLEKKGLAIRQD